VEKGELLMEMLRSCELFNRARGGRSLLLEGTNRLRTPPITEVLQRA
jgi:hypothetical protein